VTRQAGIYIHIPFCARKCTYCNFNTTDFEESLTSRYAAAVSSEIAYWGGQVAGDRLGAIDTIYFGGGTPSIVEADQVAELIAACRTCFSVADDAEITIEINPGSLTRDKSERWLTAGVNRASVGIQSFIDRELVQLSRTHTADDAFRTVDLLRTAGFSNISLDLIAGLPEQTLAGWRFNLIRALDLAPEHLSLYLLEVKEGTQLFGQIKRGLRSRPDDDLAAEMYQLIRETLAEAGYEHYEISNFARTGLLRSKHNMKYWTGAAFYGMGCGAHSYDRRSRWVNTLKTETYIESVAANGNAVAERHELTEADRASEALFMGLRLIDGLDLTEFENEYGVNVIERYGDEMRPAFDAGLVELSGRRLRLTAAGLPLSNEVFMAFV
jgi:oxygen-independent coproporphyrinogen-3 oxidase